MFNNFFIIFDIKGKQYKTYMKNNIKIEKISLNKKIFFFLKNILLIKYKNIIKIGNPFIKKIKLLCLIQKHIFSKKIKIFKMKKRKNYRKFKGYRQKYTKIKIISIKKIKKGVSIGS